MNPLAETLKVLGDETRLRIIRLLTLESLNVGELTSILGLAQPTVSKHLAELRKAGLVVGTRNCGFSYYRMADEMGEWWDSLRSALEHHGDEKGDLTRLQELLKQREERSEIDRFVVPGRSWVAWSRSLSFLLPELRVADFGCGDGAFTLEIARWANQVIAIDSNPAFLKMAQQQTNGAENIRFLEESMEDVSLPSRSVDLVVISQSLHYVEEPLRVLREAHRLLASRGRILVLELYPHDEQWVVSELNHRWLGFEPEAVQEWLGEAGFSGIRVDEALRTRPEPFRTFIATGIKKS
ncbi:MAG: ArsR/SmtB family transcription factor [Acidobacteriota bacterium]